MAKADALCDLRAQFPACELIAFADLSAHMVLMTSAADTVPQERWDGLCEMARDALRAGSSPQLLACLGAPPEHASLTRAARLSAAEYHVFLTASSVPDFALCALCQKDLPLADFYAAAQPILDRLVTDD